jgi:hypothetical protein
VVEFGECDEFPTEGALVENLRSNTFDGKLLACVNVLL